MSGMLELQERLSLVERDLADLKSQMNRFGTANNWIEQVRGSFQDDPEFDEILRLGRELREADRCEAE